MEPEKIIFPCDYPIKVVARASDDLRERIGRPQTIVFDDPRGLSLNRPEGVIPLDELIERGRAQVN